MPVLIMLACAVAVAVGGWNLWNERTQSHPPGILAPAAPFQKNFARPIDLPRSGYRLEARAEFEITARVISRSRFRFDPMAHFMPVDFALGWGRMSDSAVLDRISCSQSHRFYACTWDSLDIIHPDEFRTHSANMHMIPDTPKIEEALLRVRRGQVVTVRGLLVDVFLPDGSGARTSMTRDDSGPGGCEIILVVGLDVS